MIARKWLENKQCDMNGKGKVTPKTKKPQAGN